MAATVTTAGPTGLTTSAVRTVFVTGLTNVGVALHGFAPLIFWWELDNRESTNPTYFKAYDDATPDHTNDDADFIVKVAAGGKGIVRASRHDGAFSTALGAAASLTAAKAGAVPTATLALNVGFE